MGCSIRTRGSRLTVWRSYFPLARHTTGYVRLTATENILFDRGTWGVVRSETGKTGCLGNAKTVLYLADPVGDHKGACSRSEEPCHDRLAARRPYSSLNYRPPAPRPCTQRGSSILHSRSLPYPKRSRCYASKLTRGTYSQGSIFPASPRSSSCVFQGLSFYSPGQ